ncbi:MAG: cobalamin-dependent protein [Dehalococcoidales bacterium]|nr:cobalamin-dependent protein [Dehalococcoidales bacterium]
MNYDVVLIHPPAVYDFRKQPLFPGPLGPSVEKIQFIKVPIGMICIANYLDRNGLKVIIDNIADRMVAGREFDVEKHIKNLASEIYAIDLHWHHHAQGAIEIARLCKRLHPDSLVVLGGLTATFFHEEIIEKYDFIDAVIRGEGEKALLEFANEFKRTGKVPQTPNVTCRTEAGDICVMPLAEGSRDLDEYEYTRFDLIEPKTSIFNHGGETYGNLVTCRGCIYNCVTCGGSSYNYRKYFGMNKPAVRSPQKIVEDIKSFNAQGITLINLYQDARMGGEIYWRELFAALREERDNLKIDRLSLDIFAPVDEEFARVVSSIGKPVMLYMTPESGDAGVRKIQGRCYSNEEIINTVKVCQKYHIPLTFFFSVGLSGENRETFKATQELWDRLCILDQIGIARHSYGSLAGCMGGPIVGPIILEPGSAAFDDPGKYGYKLLFANLEEYIDALSQPSWHQWLNHETEALSRDGLVELILESVLYSISEREKYGAYDQRQAYEKQTEVNTDRIAVGEVDKIMNIADEAERRSKLKALRETVDSYLRSRSAGRV